MRERTHRPGVARQCVREVGANPKQYLREATLRAIGNPGTVSLPRELLTG